ncbi:MAG: hypothetical protein MZV63_37130 [Marinilabiliales bacterium]|nr:hypothetical protein [Marinilabiliales bacterium]
MQWISLPQSEQGQFDGASIPPSENQINAEGKKVLVIGGGDTGSDCVGTAIRQKAKTVTQIEILPKPPVERTSREPMALLLQNPENINLT